MLDILVVKLGGPRICKNQVSTIVTYIPYTLKEINKGISNIMATYILVLGCLAVGTNNASQPGL